MNKINNKCWRRFIFYNDFLKNRLFSQDFFWLVKKQNGLRHVNENKKVQMCFFLWQICIDEEKKTEQIFKLNCAYVYF